MRCGPVGRSPEEWRTDRSHPRRFEFTRAPTKDPCRARPDHPAVGRHEGVGARPERMEGWGRGGRNSSGGSGGRSGRAEPPITDRPLPEDPDREPGLESVSARLTDSELGGRWSDRASEPRVASNLPQDEGAWRRHLGAAGLEEAVGAGPASEVIDLPVPDLATSLVVNPPAFHHLADCIPHLTRPAKNVGVVAVCE